ncbi:MAG: DUF2149 domain-containing protein [Methylotenera sp.]|nr:DUF2149 domain-containing protein [Methylotenera sp.]
MQKKHSLDNRLNGRFNHEDEDPRASLVNLVDVMLVFACGLLAALSAGQQSTLNRPQEVNKGREIETPSTGEQSVGNGYDAIGQVYRDPKTGKLFLIESTPELAADKGSKGKS